MASKLRHLLGLALLPFSISLRDFATEEDGLFDIEGPEADELIELDAVVEVADSITQAAVDCEALRDTTVEGHVFDTALLLVCNAMEGLGFEDLDDVKRILIEAFDDGGVWEKFQQLRNDRKTTGYCWKNMTKRNLTTGTCDVEVGGECYDTCGYGFVPLPFSENLPDPLKAVCQSKCAETAHPQECVFGCATDTWSCGHQMMTQMGTILQGVGDIASLVTGDRRLEQMADVMVEVSDFVFEVMPKMFRIIQDGITITEGSESMSVSLVLLYQFIIEHALDDGLDIASGTAQMLIALTKALRGLASGDVTNGVIDSGLITNILKNGTDLLEFASTLAGVFDYSHCEVPTVAFTIADGPGNEAIVGEWAQQRRDDDQVKYFQIDNRKIGMRYNRRQKAWQIYKDGWLGSIVNRKVWYSANSDNETVFPVDGWEVKRGDAPPPNNLFTMLAAAASDDMNLEADDAPEV